jgi:hypothetical protein
LWINLHERMSAPDRDSGAHLALRARVPDMVVEFHATALAADGSSVGPPGVRTQHGEGY